MAGSGTTLHLSGELFKMLAKIDTSTSPIARGGRPGIPEIAGTLPGIDMISWSTPADTLAFRDSEEARLAPIIKSSGARVD